MHRKYRSGAEQRHAERRGRDCGDGDRNKGLRGLHSKSSSSTARSDGGNGRSENSGHAAGGSGDQQRFALCGRSGSNCAISDPTAPPVMMIGPSAPNGPPVPIEIADESGLRTATLGSIRLRPNQDRLDRLRDAVTADLLRAVARHDADDDTADDGNEYDPITEPMLIRGLKNRREVLIEGKVGDDGD